MHMFNPITTFKTSFGFWYRGVVGAIQDWLDPLIDLPAALPSKTIGNSVSGLPIFAYTIGHGARNVLVLGTTHGNEVGTRKLVHKLLNVIWQKRTDLAFTFHAIPLLNPDGYLQALLQPDYFSGGRVGRFNAHDVDLNRNYPTSSFSQTAIWSRGDNYQEHVVVNAGDHPLSEPESLALLGYVRQNNISLIISYHSVGGDIVCSADKLAKNLTHAYCQLTGFSWQSDRDWQQLNQTGTLKEWCEEHKISFMEIENSCRWGSDWKKQNLAISNLISQLTSLGSAKRV